MDRNAYQMLIAFNRETKKLDDVYRSAAKSCGISECAFWILYTLRVEEKSFTQAEICEFLIERSRRSTPRSKSSRRRAI